MSVLAVIQREMEELYRLPTFDSVDRYLIDKKTVLRYHSLKKTDLQETLLLQEIDSSLHLGLYVDPEILAILEETPPWSRLTNRNLEPFCTAVEGVSHFLLMITRYAEDRPVSQLELELQAEIDKYLLCSLLLERQQERLAHQMLPTTLFDQYHLLPHLTPEETERYQLANRLGFQICRRLQRLLGPLSRTGWVRAARNFHSQGLAGKLHSL